MWSVPSRMGFGRGWTGIIALAALAATAGAATWNVTNIYDFDNAMRNLSQGRATHTMEPSTYGPAPQDVLDGVV